MLNFESSIRLTRPRAAGPKIKRMLVKAGIAERLTEEMLRCSVSPARLAERCGVSIQAIEGWQKTGRFHRKHQAALADTGMDVNYIVLGKRTAAPQLLNVDVLERALAEMATVAAAFPRKRLVLHPDLAAHIAEFYSDLASQKAVSDATANELLKALAAGKTSKHS